MTTTGFLRRLVASTVSVAVLGLGTQFAAAQDISASHLQAARKAIAAIHATDQFDTFLPGTARDLKNELMRKDPNLEKVISETVDEQALALAPRRADLEKEAARAYAKYFTENELNAISNFYNTEAGKKLVKQGPTAMVEALNAYNIWRQGIAQDLAANVGKTLQEKLHKDKGAAVPAAQSAGK